MKQITLIFLSIIITPLCFAESLRTSFELQSPLMNVEADFEPCLPVSDEFTSVDIHEDLSHTGAKSINFIPNGNPITKLTHTNYCTSPTLSVSSTSLITPLKVTGSKYVDISFFYYSTSNPRKAEEHNCDSSLNTYIKKDDGEWEALTALCGEHKSQNSGWKEVRLQVNLSDNTTFNLGFSYQLQNSTTIDRNAVFLIDDLLIRPAQ